MLLYCAYQAQSDALAPLRLFADAARGLLDQPWPGIADLPLVRGAAAALNLFSHTRLSHERAPFGIDRVTVDGAEIAVSEEVVAVHPFCRLVHFRKAAALDQPKLLMVAPLSGHFATLLRDTVATALPDHDVYLTDWLNARSVPAEQGGFGLDDEIELIIDWIRRLGPGSHVVAVCQPSVPVLAAVSLMAAANDRCQPRSMVLMGGPIDPEANDAHWRMFRDLAEGNGHSARAAVSRAFYDEYSTVMDLPADFYLDTVDRVFQRQDLAHGRFRVRGELVDHGAITDTALMTVEGERDDICGPGQTVAAQNLCGNLAPAKKTHHLQRDVGHYGVFHGRRWQSEIYPKVRAFIRSHG